MSGHAARRAGFTLLEVMLAMTILAIVTTALYGTFSRTLRSRALAEERAEITRTGRAALARMTDELSAAFYPRRQGTAGLAGALFRSLPGGTAEEPFDSVAFSALAPRPSGLRQRGSAHQVIAYFFPEERGRMGRAGGGDGGLEDDDSEALDPFEAFDRPAELPRGLEARRLLRREALVLQQNELAPATATLFLDNVAGLRLRFHDGRDWIDDWDSEDRTYGRPLPRAIEIDLALYDTHGDIHHFATAIDLPLADPRGARTTGATPGGGTPGSGSGGTTAPSRLGTLGAAS
jgi:general secretion pathway protein J